MCVCVHGEEERDTKSSWLFRSVSLNLSLLQEQFRVKSLSLSPAVLLLNCM